MNTGRVLAARPQLWAFLCGCVAVSAGVALHLPMFWMGRNNGFRLADMPMDAAMGWGMALIVGGIAVAGYGLLPRAAAPGPRPSVRVLTPQDQPLSWAHGRLMGVLTVALVIDVMKPASLGFVLPGMASEYGISKLTVAWLPFAALCGTVVGSVLWGWLADLYGRRAAILLSAVMFVGTAICGAMPSLWWNVGMCFLMGAAAGGMLPVTYALLAETIPSKQRGWALVLVGGLGAVGGYLAASAAAGWLEPLFSWRILWFLNLPTGLQLIFLNAFIPESPKFLLDHGRAEEARTLLRRFGSVVETAPALDAASLSNAPTPRSPRQGVAARTWALSVAAIAWGLINFGLLLWMPVHLVESGYSMAVSSALLSASALIAIPTVFVAALLYGRWSSKAALLVAIAVTALGLAWLVALELHAPPRPSPVWPVALLIIGSNGIIAMLLPYAAESYPAHIRARATGWVAACTKGGGLIAQLLSLMGWVPVFFVAAILVFAPLLLAFVLIWRHCVETRGRDLHQLEIADALVPAPRPTCTP
ncbi:MAG TPA: MFS transporter [Burkholderiaceae bacterium]|jgi:putative MFS transporter